LATNLSIHNTIKILSKLSVFESIAFAGVWKVLGLLLVLADTTNTPEVFFNNKGGKSLFAYNQGLREGIKEENRTRAHYVLGPRKIKIRTPNFFCNQAQTF